jgi:hypothetical protein
LDGFNPDGFDGRFYERPGASPGPFALTEIWSKQSGALSNLPIAGQPEPKATIDDTLTESPTMCSIRAAAAQAGNAFIVD